MTNECPVYYKNGRIYDNQMTNVEKILHSKKLNYKDLKEISDPYFKDNNVETINIFIDLFDIFKQFYSPMLNEEFKTIRTPTKMNLISELINIVGHYRHFFYSRYGKYTTIIMYYSSTKDKYLLSIDPDYKKDFYNKRILTSKSECYIVNKVLHDCLSIVREYLSYIPHAYLIDTTGIEPSFLPYFIINGVITDSDLFNKISGKDYNIIMANNDLYLSDLIKNDNTIIFKNNGKDKYYLSRADIFDYLKLNEETSLPESSLKKIFALSGNKSYGIANIKKMGLKKAYKHLEKVYKTDPTLSKIEDSLKEEDKERYLTNMKLISKEIYPLTDMDKLNILNQFVDIIDLEFIKEETFNTFDASCVVMLDYLFDGEEA